MLWKRQKGEKGATIVIGDNANGIQIQQNSAHSSQTMTNSQGLDYEKVKSVLEEIKSYFNYPQFEQIYGDNADNNLKRMCSHIFHIVEDSMVETIEAMKLSEVRNIENECR